MNDVLFVNNNVVISVWTILFVVESDSVADLMRDDALVSAASGQNDRMLTPVHANVGRAAGPVFEKDVVRVAAGGGSEGDAGVVLPLFDSLHDFSVVVA